ncbi:MAG: hypothetical protein KDD91_01350, partial [Caldilinea sp.]|nr:hypothetical protein [Caldilinea sp.]
AKLKQTMLLLEPTFNEVNIGHTQFKEWLERSTDLVTLYARENQIYVALPDFEPGPEWEARPWPSSSHANGQAIRTAPALASAAAAEPAVPVKLSLRQQYNQIFTRLKMTSVDFATRRDVLRDIYRELRERPGERTTDELLEELCERYETQGLIRSKTTLRQIWQMGFRQRAFDYQEQVASVHVPVWLDAEIDSEAA